MVCDYVSFIKIENQTAFLFNAAVHPLLFSFLALCYFNSFIALCSFHTFPQGEKSDCTLFLWHETEQTKGFFCFFCFFCFVLTKTFISVPRQSKTAELAKAVD